WIEVKSEVGVGTTFDIYFPAAAKAVEAVAESASHGNEMPAGRNETILLVEDEPVLRAWVQEILKNGGYKVLEASNGVEALKVWDEHNGRVDLLLTDMVMPEGMTGSDLAKQLRSREPQLKVIYTSGYSAEIMGSENELRDAPFLPK